MNPNIDIIINVGTELKQVESEISALKRISEKLKDGTNFNTVFAEYPQQCSTIKKRIYLTNDESIGIINDRISPLYVKRDFLIKQLEGIAP